MKRNRVGRPSLRASQARSHRVATFVTQGEFKKLRGLADKNGKSVSTLIYELLSIALTQLKQAHKKQV